MPRTKATAQPAESDSNVVELPSAKAVKKGSIAITPPNFKTATFRIVGTAPFVQLKFSEKAINEMKAKHEAGSTSKKGKTRTARDFNAEYDAAIHRSPEGWAGIPAGAFRAAMVAACRTVNFKMTLAKLGVFVEADGIDATEGTPLVRIYGEPEMVIHHVRNATGVADLRTRAMWREWHTDVRIRYDADMFSLEDITNLLARVGMQVGIGEGRPAARDTNSVGMGWGLFMIEGATVREA